MKPVIIEVSGVLPSPATAVWKLISDFSDTRDYRVRHETGKPLSDSQVCIPTTTSSSSKDVTLAADVPRCP
jgi:hypothetical protein